MIRINEKKQLSRLDFSQFPKLYMTDHSRQMYRSCNTSQVQQQVRDYIKSSYASVFCADIGSFLPNLVVSQSGAEIDLAFGYTDAAKQDLFLEAYLDQPIEQFLSARVGQSIARNKIVEVGNLAMSNKSNAATNIRDIALYLQSQGFDWIVCTATRMLRFLFLKSGTTPLKLNMAKQEKISNSQTNWGTYYRSSPEVLAGNIKQSIYQIEDRMNSLQLNRALNNLPMKDAWKDRR